jgi:hypothetical protein
MDCSDCGVLKGEVAISSLITAERGWRPEPACCSIFCYIRWQRTNCFDCGVLKLEGVRSLIVPCGVVEESRVDFLA